MPACGKATRQQPQRAADQGRVAPLPAGMEHWQLQGAADCKQCSIRATEVQSSVAGTPTLFTRMSRRPYSSCTRATMALQAGRQADGQRRQAARRAGRRAAQAGRREVSGPGATGSQGSLSHPAALPRGTSTLPAVPKGVSTTRLHPCPAPHIARLLAGQHARCVPQSCSTRVVT
jgi:hypothetical protein